MAQKLSYSNAPKFKLYHSDSLNPSNGDRYLSSLKHLPYGEMLYRKNRKILSCPPQIREALHRFYQNLETEWLNKEDVLQLAGGIIPHAGFLSGCIYFYEPLDRLLIPKVPIGSSSLELFTKVDCSPLAPGVNPIATAFHCDVTISTRAFSTSGARICLSHVIGKFQRLGVLYLETNTEAEPHRNGDPETIFEALCQALQDSLRVS